VPGAFSLTVVTPTHPCMGCGASKGADVPLPSPSITPTVHHPPRELEEVR
jgi:hypothetical protein